MLRQPGAIPSYMQKQTMMQSHFMSAAALKRKRFRLHTMGFRADGTGASIIHPNHLLRKNTGQELLAGTFFS